MERQRKLENFSASLDKIRRFAHRAETPVFDHWQMRVGTGVVTGS